MVKVEFLLLEECNSQERGLWCLTPEMESLLGQSSVGWTRGKWADLSES